jgi:hypothetical protein
VEQYADYLLGKYRNAGVLVDTNLLLLYFVGTYDTGLVERFSRTADRFAADDFDTLALLLEQFDRLVVTPHVLTEVSNMIGHLKEPARTTCFALFGEVIRSVMDEKHTSGAALSNDPAFVVFGVTDTSIFDAAAGSYLVLTDDLPLYKYLEGKGIDVLNFNEIRTIAY